MVAERAVWLDPLPLGCSVPEHGVRRQELLCWGRGLVMDKIQNPKHGPNPQWSASATQAPPRGSFPTLSDSGSIVEVGTSSRRCHAHISLHIILRHIIYVSLAHQRPRYSSCFAFCFQRTIICLVSL